MLFLQEVKVSPEDGKTVRAVERAVRANPMDGSSEPDYVAHMCLPSDKFNARGFGRKVYGVSSIIRKDFADKSVDRVRPVSWDLEGRVLVTEKRADDSGPKLAVFNVYAVNGTDSAYKDMSTGEITGTRHDRKLQFHKLLAAESRRLHAEGYGVIIAGDMNVARSAMDGHPNLRTFPYQHCVNRADFEARFFSKALVPQAEQSDFPGDQSKQDEAGVEARLDMIDTFRFLHPNKKGYTYYPRGSSFGDSCDRVDMILVSSSLEHSLIGAGMHETPGDRGPSDHVPVFARLTFRKQTGKQGTEEHAFVQES